MCLMLSQAVDSFTFDCCVIYIYTSLNLTDDHDPCTNVNCNHGTCIPLLQEKLAYTCKCKDGFTSQDCSTKSLSHKNESHD